MICKYKYKLNDETIKEFDSYAQLLNYIDSNYLNEIKDFSDIVFSKERQIEISDRIKELKETYVPKTNSGISSLLNDEPDIEGRMSILDFFNTPQFTEVQPFNEEDFKKGLINKLTGKNVRMSQEEAEKTYQTLHKHQKTMQKAAVSLHPMYTDYNVWQPSGQDASFKERISDEVKSELFETPEQTLSILYNDLKSWYMMHKGRFVNSVAFSNINLSSKIKGLDRDIFGHIDYLFVGEDGTLQLYIFKTTEQLEKQWSDDKRNIITYQLSFLKRMLQNNGIPVNDDKIILNVVPIKVNLNENNKIVSLKVQNTSQYSSTLSGTYRRSNANNVAARYIEDNSTPFHISDEPINRANEVSRLMFQNLHIKEEGISRSAQAWIANAASDYYENEPLVIKFIGEVDHAYDVKIGNNVYPIKNAKNKNNNPEILELVKNHISELNDHRGYFTNNLKEAIKTRLNSKINANTFSSTPGFQAHATRLNQKLLAKYFSDYNTKTDKDGNVTIEHNWELLPNLLDCNVLIFRNKNTKIIDVISISGFDLHAQAPFNKGTNILGDFKRDSQYIDLEGTYGNIEIVKAMNLINEILPSLGDVILGNVSAMTTIGGANMITYNISEFNRKYYSKIINTVSKETGQEIKSNFNIAKLQDLKSELVKAYNDILSHGSGKYTNYEFERYENAITVSEQLQELERIQKEILLSYPNFADYDYLRDTINNINNNSDDKQIAVLYELATRAFLALRGETPEYKTKVNKLELEHMTATTISDPNVRTVVNNLQITHDTISSEFLEIFDERIRPKFDEFYKNIGYNSAQNMSLGNQAQQYQNLYDWDSEYLSFKNPYDTSNDLSIYERNILKFALKEIAKIRSNGNFDLKGKTEEQYIAEHPEYLWVPLEKASAATTRQSGKAVVAKMKNFWRQVLNSKERFENQFNNTMVEEIELLSGEDQSVYQMSVRNPFDTNMYNSQNYPEDVQKRRKEMLEKYGKHFFETNLENIVIDVLAKQISTTQFNKLLVATKALLLQLRMTGDYFGTNHVTNKTVKWIEDYLKINVFKTSIMSDTEKAIVGTVLPVKKVVTDMILGGNIVSMVRDTIEGAEQNFIRSIIKLNTDISPKNVSKAYAFVNRYSTSNAMATNLLSKLCLKYRISNTDVGRISERAKSGRNGLVNFDNWMYSTLRGPDFVNRMVLFVARCIEDGVIDGDNLYDLSKHAYFINENGQLEYDWKKDKRFNLYAANDKSDIVKYNKQKSLFLSKRSQYNKEHPNKAISDTITLPEPYTNQEIMTVRGLGDNIYGSYDRGKKAMNENQAYGTLFGMFTTWMNGITNIYFMKPQKNNVTKLQKTQAINDKGEALYFDQYGNILTLEEGGDENLPVLEDEPVIVQGIYWTVKELVKLVKNDGMDAMVKYLKSEPQEKANMLKLGSDLLMWLFLSMLFKLLITPEYQDYKKNMKEQSLLANIPTEIIYKASSRSYDQFAGVFNLVEFFGENLNPPYYTIPVQLMKETGEALFGEKSWKYLLFDNTGITRSIKDSAFAEIKKNTTN